MMTALVHVLLVNDDSTCICLTCQRFFYLQTSRKQRLWSKSGSQGDQWILAQVPLTSAQSSQQFSIIFEGVAGAGVTGDIAIDDVSISSQACTTPGKW